MEPSDSGIGTFGYDGLTDSGVLKSRQTHGRNRVEQKRSGLIETLGELVRDPMLLLLIAACSIYFITGQTGDGVFMLFAIALTTSISLYQERRSHKALKALESLTEPEGRVIRNGQIVWIPIAEVVVGDLILAEEGRAVAADAVILNSNDFSVNESIMTGESLPVMKTKEDGNNRVYQGTSVNSGLAVCEVEAVGVKTELGKIGKSIETIQREETPLQKQIKSFVGKMAYIGAVFFVAV